METCFWVFAYKNTSSLYHKPYKRRNLCIPRSTFGGDEPNNSRREVVTGQSTAILLNFDLRFGPGAPHSFTHHPSVPTFLSQLSPLINTPVIGPSLRGKWMFLIEEPDWIGFLWLVPVVWLNFCVFGVKGRKLKGTWKKLTHIFHQPLNKSS